MDSPRSAWEPSFDTRMTLKQLGFAPSQIDKCLSDYNENCPHPTDGDFRCFVAEQLGMKPKPLDLHWRPTKETSDELMAQGYSDDVISCAVDEWIMGSRELGYVVVHRDAAFKAFVETKYPLRRRGALSRASQQTLLMQGISQQDISRATSVLKQITPTPTTDIPEADVVRFISALSSHSPSGR